MEYPAASNSPRHSTHWLILMEQLRESLSVESFVVEANVQIKALEEKITNNLENQVTKIKNYFAFAEMMSRSYEGMRQILIAGKLHLLCAVLISFQLRSTSYPDPYETLLAVSLP